MNKIALILTIAAFAGMFVACESSPTPPEKISGEKILTSIGERSITFNIGELDGIEKFNPKDIDLSDIESIQLKSRESLSQKDREDVSTIMREFMNAENNAAELDVELLMSEEPVEDGVFVFSIETPKAQNLAVQMYDEEGFEMAANNKIALHEGTNFKALNVKSLENGQYIFLLKDDFGREIMRKLTVEHQ